VAPRASRKLIDHALWTLVPTAADPWAEFRPQEDISCSDAARLTEDFGGLPAYNINTVQCSYTTVVQPTLADACKGETFYVWLWNFALTGPPDAVVHAAVQLGDDALWQAEKAIPAVAGLVIDRIVLKHDVPAGTPIYFHLRNHGANQYDLLDLTIVNPDPDVPPGPPL